MNVKKIYILGIILVVVVALIVIQDKLSTKKPTEQEIKFFPSLTGQSIGTILIREGTSAIELKRTGDIWKVLKPSNINRGTTEKSTLPPSPLRADSSTVSADITEATEYPVDSASITTAIEKLTTLKKNELISQNPEKQTIFEVDTTKGIMVDIADNAGKPLGSFIIGKSGADYNSNYIRQKGSNSVYIASGGIRYSFFTDLTRWRNKSIITFDKSTAQGITLAKSDGSMITIAHADSGNPWEIITPIKNPAKADEVEGILEKLSHLVASDFQDTPLSDTAMGFNKPELGVTISFKNGSSRHIIFGKKNSDNKYWVKTDGKEQLYLIGDYTLNQINKKLDELKGEPLVKPIKADSTKKKEK